MDQRVVIDVSRTVSRLHLPAATGIDRVEAAYIRRVLENHPGSFALAKLGREYLFCDLETFFRESHKNFDGAQIGLIDKVRLKLTRDQRKVKSSLRRSIGWTDRARLCLKLRSEISKNDIYINVGHSRMSKEVQVCLNTIGCKSWFMVHDVIPLTHPEMVRVDIPPRFKEFINSISDIADRVIFNSQASQIAAKGLFSNTKELVAHLGVDGPFQRGVNSKHPFFLTVGTIEPRKNHNLLLDIWKHGKDEKGNRLPKLVIVGQDGWAEKAVFEKIEELQKIGRVDHIRDADDALLLSLYSECTALLFPSLAEGYGLPLMEAIEIGKPVIASDIPVFRELLGPNAPLLSPQDIEAWKSALLYPEKFQHEPRPWTWDQHFELVGL
ncbi:MAG: glycosyltransferase family 1 protein [Pseudomonadota bacterium]